MNQDDSFDGDVDKTLVGSWLSKPMRYNIILTAASIGHWLMNESDNKINQTQRIFLINTTNDRSQSVICTDHQ